MGDPDTDLKQLDQLALRNEIVKMRKALRYHRDQKGDDRCWLDDDLLYELMPETPPSTLLPSPAFMERCQRFHEARQCPEQVVNNASCTLDTDEDLALMDDRQFLPEALRLRAAIREHRDAGEFVRDWRDDKKLYALLPDTTQSNTSLPSQVEFLESCEWFFQTRTAPLKLHEW